MSFSSKSIKTLFLLNGKKAVVTGSGGGIGRVIAEGLAEYGVDVALLDVNKNNMNQVKKSIEKRFSTNVLAITADVRISKEIEMAISRIVDEFRSIDILVNCHGVGHWIPAEEMSDEEWDYVLDVNLKGVFVMCRTVGKKMIEQRNGKIVNFASMSACIVNRPQTQAHYNSSKAGVVMLTKSLATEWAKYNININCISPGYTLTPMVKNLLKNKPEYKELWLPLVPMGRLATPIDIVGPVIFLVSEAAAYVTGHNFVVDGGYSIW